VTIDTDVTFCIPFHREGVEAVTALETSRLTAGPTSQSGVTLRCETLADAVRVRIEGRLDSTNAGDAWRQLSRELGKTPPPALSVDAAGLAYCDVSGVGLLMDLQRRQAESGGRFEIVGLREEIRRLVDLFPVDRFRAPTGTTKVRRSLPVEVGRATVELLKDIRELLTFIGHVIVSFLQVLRNPGRLRWSDAFVAAEAAGVNALSITILMGFIMGLIIAFQTAMSLRRFAAEIFVADAVVMAMFREIGPFFTAIVLAGRSGSAFAAELGTMKVREEVDALKTMGLDPVPFLAIPRLLATVIVTPMLTLFANLAGLIGGGLVYVSVGLTMNTYVQRIMLRGDLVDLLGGLAKAVVFGILVGAAGCLSGLRTGTGARAVGESTTRSVVSGIVLIVVADGLLGVLYYYLGV
jgi:phospholipid/cholesterol/gamma-HCH transport system permease protein